MTSPAASRTVRVTQTCIPLTGYSIRFCWPTLRAVVYCTESPARCTLRMVGLEKVTVRPVGGPQISKRTVPGVAKPRIRRGNFVSFRNRMLCWEPPLFQTVASRPIG